MTESHGLERDRRLRIAVIDACRALPRLRLSSGTSGNISVRRDERHCFISPTGMAYEALQVEDIPLLQLQGRWFGRSRPSSEWRFHRDIYLSRSDAGAIVHTHSPMATSLACTGRGIPAFHYIIIAVAGGVDIRCAAYNTFGTQELSDAALAALEGSRPACSPIMASLPSAPTSAPALALAAEVENLAAQYCTALAIGAVQILDAQQMQRVLDKFRTYGHQDAADADLAFGAAVSPP